MAAKGRELQEGELGAKMKKFLESPNDERMKQHLTNYGVAVLLETLKDDLICRQYDNCGYYWSTEGKKTVSGQVGFEAAALFVLDEIGAAELARRHKQAQPQPSMARFEARAKAAVSKVQDAADLASRKARKAERERKALESNLAERLLDEYVERRFGPDCAEGKAKEAEGAVEDDEGGGQSSGDQSGAGQSGADESSGASDEAAGGGTAALRRQLAECKLQLEQVCAEAGCGAPLTLPHTGPYTPYLSSHRRAVCVEVERGAPFTPLTSHAHPLPSAHTLISPCTPYAPCTPHAPLL